MSLYQILLPNGRGLRFEPLAPTECDDLLRDCAKLIGEDGTMMDLRTTVQLTGVKRMIKAVTTVDGLKDTDLPTAKWKDVTEQDLDAKYNELFNAKAHMVLGALYREYHEIGQSDVDDIVKKALQVSVD